MNRYGIRALAEVTVRSDGCARSAHPSLRPRVGLFRAAVLAFALGTAQGCYVYTPVLAARPAGSILAFDINDRGRVEMGDLVGPSVARIEGALRSESDTGYVVNVSSVMYLNGQRNTWAGEELTVRKAHVASVREREFSRWRSALAAGGLVAAVVGFILSRDLAGSAPNPTEPPIGEPPVGT